MIGSDTAREMLARLRRDPMPPCPWCDRTFDNRDLIHDTAMSMSPGPRTHPCNKLATPRRYRRWHAHG